MNSARSGDLEVLVVPSTTTLLNRNTNLSTCVMRAFTSRLGAERVSLVQLGDAADRIHTLSKRAFVLLFGSALPDECSFEGTCAIARERGIPVAFWTTEDPYEFDACYKFVDSVDLIFTNDKWTQRHYGFFRRNGVYHLPLAASRESHFREVLVRDNDYMYDVFFCGVGFENRRRVIEGLHPVLARLETLICGAEWSDLAPYVQNRRMAPNELLDAYQHSRIVLNMGRDFSYANDRFQITASTPGPRAFEAAMAGGFQLAFGDRPEYLDYYDLGSEVVLFDGLRSAQELITHFLDHPDERMSITRAAQRRTLRDHQYENRVDEIMRRILPLIES